MNRAARWRALPDGGGHVRVGEAPALRTADGHFLRLHQVPDRSGRPLRHYLRRVSDVAAERERQRSGQAWSASVGDVVVVGRDRLARLLAHELGRRGVVVRRLAGGAAAAGATGRLVVAVRDAAPDTDRDAWLDALPSTGRTVLRGHRDGDQFHLLPLAVDGSEATADQVRRRRLAAAAAPAELDSWLSDPPPRLRPLGPAAHGLVVATCLTILADWATDAPAVVEHRRLLRVLDADLRLREHTVLGFDEPAPVERPGR